VSLPGLSRDPSTIHFNKNSGAQGLNLLVNWGFREIGLLGFDMQKTGGRAHFFGDHPAGLRKTSPYNDWRSLFVRIAADAKDMGVKVANCSRETALTCFERMTLEDFLA
jgi:hypothetical protein